MKTRTGKHGNIVLIILGIFLFFVTGFAQFEDDDLLLEPVNISCSPDTLRTPYDQYKQMDLKENDLKMWYSFGSEYYKQQDYKAALPYLWRVFINDTSKMGQLAIRKIADAYFNLQMVDSTLIACFRGLENYPDLSSLHYYAGILQMNLGKNECAIPHYEFLVKNHPENESYLDKMGYLYYKMDDERAIDIQKKLVALAPDNAEYHTRLAFYMEYFGFDALNDLRIAYDKNPDNMNVAKQLAKSELNAGNYSKAAELFTRILKNVSEQPALLKSRAQAYEGMGDYRKAISDYKTFLNKKPNDLEAMCAIATDYKFLNKFAEGKYWVKKAAGANSQSGLPHIVMAEIYEAAVIFTQNTENRGRKLDDGLVYQRAIAEYEKAANDPAYTAYANDRIKLLEPLKPTREELFFANGDTKLKSESYTSWIED
ncbi:MAG: tetratricopeptide repeat protein [Calditrichaceae bacterium]